jgi:hypothetical protein
MSSIAQGMRTAEKPAWNKKGRLDASLFLVAVLATLLSAR